MSEVNLTATFTEPSIDLQLKATIMTVPAELVIYNEELRQYVENIKNEVNESVNNITQNLTVGVAGRLGYRFTVNTQSGASYTPVLADEGTLIRMTHNQDNTFVLPNDTAVAFDTGTILNVRQAGIGVTTIVPQAGVTVNTPDDSLKVDSMNLGLGLVKVGPNEWDLVKSFVGVPLAEVENFTNDVEYAITQMETAQTDLTNTVEGLSTSLETSLTDFQSHLDERITAAIAEADAAIAALGDVPTLSDFETLKSKNGYQRLPGGLILQWGTHYIGTMENATNFSVNFTIPFPTACLNANLSDTFGVTSDGKYDEGMTITSTSKSGFTAYSAWKWWAGRNTALSASIAWFAIGH